MKRHLLLLSSLFLVSFCSMSFASNSGFPPGFSKPSLNPQLPLSVTCPSTNQLVHSSSSQYYFFLIGEGGNFVSGSGSRFYNPIASANPTTKIGPHGFLTCNYAANYGLTITLKSYRPINSNAQKNCTIGDQPIPASGLSCNGSSRECVISCNS